MQYSVFGSSLTIGGVIGGLVSGRIADLFGRKGVSFKTIKLVLFSRTGPCLVQLMGLFFVPESPRWLVGPNILMGM